MVFNYMAECPICGKKTDLRIEDGSYLNEYPIRVNCMNCRALIKGVYIMAENSSFNGLHLDNAKFDLVMPDERTGLIAGADYIAEISGELPCRPIRKNNGASYKDTVFIETTKHIAKADVMINRLSHFSEDFEMWRKQRSVAFQLFEEGSFEYLPKALKKSGIQSYKVANDLQALHCMQEVVLKETRYLFTNENPYDVIKTMLLELSELDREQLQMLISAAGGEYGLIASYQKLMDVFSNFMRLYPSLLPAEIYMHYSNMMNANVGMSTCTFSDIKEFYQDSYETIMSCVHFAVCLDNIRERGNNYSFTEETNKIMRRKNADDDYHKFLLIDNGAKLGTISCKENLQSLLLLPPTAGLRNGIGHNNYHYDAITQTITVFNTYKRDKVKRELSLLEMACECCDMVVSAVILSEIILFLLRNANNTGKCISHLAFYDGVAKDDTCPCGSAKKYEDCCMPTIVKKYSKRSLQVNTPKIYIF